jgi:hypothetical protein
VTHRHFPISTLACADAPPGVGSAGGIDKFALYQDAVQAPHGDISWILRFYRQYVGLQVCTESWEHPLLQHMHRATIARLHGLWPGHLHMMRTAGDEAEPAPVRCRCICGRTFAAPQ